MLLACGFVARRVTERCGYAPLLAPRHKPKSPATNCVLSCGLVRNLTKELGRSDSATHTAEETAIAGFWADGAGTVTPPGHWNIIAREVADQRGNTLDQNARLFALLNIAEADAAIIAWDCPRLQSFRGEGELQAQVLEFHRLVCRVMRAVAAGFLSAGGASAPLCGQGSAWTPRLGGPYLLARSLSSLTGSGRIGT